MKTALVYLRVSTAKQVNKEVDPDGISLPVQKQYVEHRSTELEALIEEYFIDRGQSARTTRRDELQRMLKRLREGPPVDYVIVLSINRLARDVGDFDRIWDDVITRSGAQLISVLETFDNSPSGRFMAHVLAAKAEYDSAQTSERVVMGMARKAQIGGTVGRAPIGYSNATNMIDGRPVKLVEIDETRAPLIQEAFQLYATGDWNLVRLTEHLSDRGLRTRATISQPEKELALSQLGKILHNPYYVGDVVVKGVTYQGRHTPLIGRDVFERVQAVFSAHDASGIRTRRHDHWAKGLVFCGDCGARMTLAVARGKYVYWLCMGRNRGEGCEMPYTAVERVDEVVVRELERWRLDPQDIAAGRADLAVFLGEERSGLLQTIKTQRRRLTSLDDERTRLLHLHLEGAIDKDLLMREQKRVTKEMGQADGILQAAEATLGDEERTYDYAASLLLEPGARFAALANDEARRQVALALVSRIKLSSTAGSSVTVRSEITLLHAAVKEAGGARYERRRTAIVENKISTEGLDDWLTSLEPGDPDRVLVGVGSSPEERVPLNNFWSG